MSIDHYHHVSKKNRHPYKFPEERARLKVFSMNLFFYHIYNRFIKYDIIKFTMLFNKQIKFEFKSRGCIFEFDLDLRKASSEFQPVRIPTLFKCLFLTEKRN